MATAVNSVRARISAVLLASILIIQAGCSIPHSADPLVRPEPGDRVIMLQIGVRDIPTQLDLAHIWMRILIDANNGHKPKPKPVIMDDGKPAISWAARELSWSKFVFSQSPQTDPPHELHITAYIVDDPHDVNHSFVCRWYADGVALLKEDITTRLSDHNLARYANCRIGVRFNEAGGITIMER